MSAERRTRALLAVLVLSVLGAGACRRAAPPVGPVIGEVRARLERVVPADLPVPAEPAILSSIRRAVEAVPGAPAVKIPPPAGAQALRLEVSLEVGWQAEAPSALRSVVHARLVPVGAATASALWRVDREALVEKEGVTEAPTANVVAAHVDHALALVVGNAIRAEQLWLAPITAARSALGDEELRDEALVVLAERRDRQSVPAIIQLLKHEDPDVRDRAIGALAEIGDPRAARPLAELAKFGDLAQLPKILDAISRVGGSEAESYLDFVAAGHPSPEIRTLAARAREHLRARTADLGTP